MEPMLGQILILPFTFAPESFLACDGQLLPISQNPALFSLLGNRFGGDGKTNFAIPNYANLAPAGSTYFIATVGVFPQR
jgi:microcystin-dependent protein